MLNINKELKQATTKEKTLSIIKPNAVSKNIIGKIYTIFEEANLKIIAAKMKTLSVEEAKQFYYIHKCKNFYHSLINFMTSGPVMIQVLEGYNAILKHRDIMGNTNPKKAKKGTIRAQFADNIEANAVHGSDSYQNSIKEINFFFKNL